MKIAEYSQQSGRQHAYLTIHALLILLLGIFLVGPLRPELLSLNDGILAVGIVYLGSLPSALYFSASRLPPMPLMPLIGLFYSISFGLVMFSESVLEGSMTGWNEQSWHSALILTLLGLVAMLAWFYFSKNVLFRSIPRFRLPNPADRYRRLKWLGWPLLVLHTAALVWNWNDLLPTLGNFLATGAGYLSLAIFFFVWLRGKLSFQEKVILMCAVLPFNIVLRFASGFLAQVVFFLFFFVLLLWYVRRRVPWKLAVLSFTFFLLFSPIKEEYRLVAWDLGRYGSTLSLWDRTALLLDLAGEYYSGGLPVSSNDNTTKLLSRLSDISIFGCVISATPSIIPYWQGETYSPLLTKWVPRALWPDKPSENYGNETGHRYDLIAPSDTDTSVNLNQLIEAYVNYGISGVIVIMSLIGSMLGLLYKLFNRPDQNDSEVIFGMSLLFPLFFPESNFSITYGGLPYSVVIYYAMLRFVLSVHWARRLVII